ncbi:MAG: hypothetical protein AB1752_04975 [Candidatus Zixiibacteriota bacterium]
MLRTSLRLLSLMPMILLATPHAAADTSFEALKESQVIADFRLENLYENDAGTAMGGRFRHVPSGFVLDLLRIQSIPQAFIWVNSPPPSDQGEPHTLEHLLLGKGTKGRYVASLEDMSLGNSSAFTMQLQTCYHYHTAAGTDVFFDLLDAKLDAMLHPNFSDEEIRREVCNIGYSLDPTDSTLRLEEKGTVYNEMVSSYERPWGNLGFELGRMLYGPGHPLSNESGGLPAAIRTMTPEDIRRFHASTHHLSNMGMVVSIPDDITLEDFFQRTSAILAKVEPDARHGEDPATLNKRLPPPVMEKEGTIRLVSFPHQNEQEPGLLLYAWPATLEYDNNEGYLLELFISNLASGQTSNLFRKFIDSQTRVIDLGANSVFGWASSDLGHPIYIGINNIRTDALSEPMIDSIRGLILAEIAQIASLPDGSEELVKFNERAKSRVIERRRELREFLNSPPGFGFRGTGAGWMEHLKHMQDTPGFRKRLTLDSELKFAEEQLAGASNFWRRYITKWGLIDRVPFAVGTRPDPKLLATSESDRDGRINQFIKGLEREYGVDDPQAAVLEFKEDYDLRTEEIDAEARTIAMPKFVDNPPLTLDDQLRFRSETLPGGGAQVVSTFDNMSSATAGLAFRMDVVPESLLLYVAALPTLLTDVGVIWDGRPIPYDEMAERIRREILELRAYYSTNPRTERVELVLRAAGSDATEALAATDWLQAILFYPDWRPENLPRLRDAIDLALKGRRNTMRGAEEAWVDDPANAYWRQTNALYLTADCFLTQVHALHRLRWQLKEAGTPVAERAFGDFLGGLAVSGARGPRAQARALLAALLGDESALDSAGSQARSILADFQALPPDAAALVKDAVSDLQQSQAEIPDGSFARDWQYLCHQMIADLHVPPAEALANLTRVMEFVRHADNARSFMIGNEQNQGALTSRIESIIARLDSSPSQRFSYRGSPHIMARLREREPGSGRPLFVGLINENTRAGVHINTTKCASYTDFDRETLLKFLSARLYGGGGAHSMFMKTWGAGLAYSNGLRSNESSGRLIYYAERCPDLAQTMQFVVNELKNAPYDSSLAQYAIAQAFAGYRGGSGYEARGEAIAADLADGVTPDVVRRFRSGILELRDTHDLYAELHSRMEYTYGEVLPGYGPPASASPEAIYFVIGPEKQMESYEQYLKSVEGADATLHRIYPRDYWLPGPAAQ